MAIYRLSTEYIYEGLCSYVSARMATPSRMSTHSSNTRTTSARSLRTASLYGVRPSSSTTCTRTLGSAQAGQPTTTTTTTINRYQQRTHLESNKRMCTDNTTNRRTHTHTHTHAYRPASVSPPADVHEVPPHAAHPSHGTQPDSDPHPGPATTCPQRQCVLCQRRVQCPRHQRRHVR